MKLVQLKIHVLLDDMLLQWVSCPQRSKRLCWRWKHYSLCK